MLIQNDKIFIIPKIRDLFLIIFSLIMLSPYSSAGIIQLRYLIIISIIWNILALISDSKTYITVLFKYGIFSCIISFVVILIYFYTNRVIFRPLFTITMIMSYYKITKMEYIKSHVNIVILYFVIVAIYSCYMFNITPGLARILASGDISYTSKYINFFTANYSLVYIISFTSLIIFYKIMFTKKYLNLIYLLIFLYFVYKSEYMTALLIIIWGIIITIVYFNYLGIYTNLGILISMFIFYFYKEPIIAFIFSNLSFIENYIKSDTLRYRYLAIQEYFIYGDQIGALKSRGDLFAMSWETFKNYPLAGIGNNGEIGYTIGNHSSVLDSLAYNGLLVFIIFVIQLFIAIYVSCQMIEIKNDRNYYILLFVMFIVFSTINIGFTSIMFYFVIVLMPIILNQFARCENIYHFD